MKSKYAMTDVQIESLARDIVAAQDVTAGGRITYIRVLVTRVQATLGRVRRGKLASVAQLEVLEDVNKVTYAAVLRGVTTPDLEPAPGLDQIELTRRSLERNRRSTFARTAKSTLSTWIEAGGDIRTLDPDEVTRDPLAAEVREKRGVNSTAYIIERRRASLIRLIEREAENDPGGARADIEATMDALQAILDDLSPKGNEVPATAPHTISGVMRTRPAHARMAGGRA